MAWPWPGYKHGAGRISGCKQNRADSMKSWEPLLALLSESSLVGLSALQPSQDLVVKYVFETIYICSMYLCSGQVSVSFFKTL